MSRRPLEVNVTDLLRAPALRRAVHLTTTPAELGVVDARLDPEAVVVIAVVLDSMTEGLALSGTVEVPWHGECRRCLVPVTSVAVVEVSEVFHPHPPSGPDDEVLPIAGDHIDLEPVVREAVMLDLPLAPLCRPDCRGLCPQCGVDRNELDCGHDDRPISSKWAALEQLRSQLEP